MAGQPSGLCYIGEDLLGGDAVTWRPESCGPEPAKVAIPWTPWVPSATVIT